MNLAELKYSKSITAALIGLFAVTAGLIIPNALKNFFLSDHWSAFLIMIIFAIILAAPIIIALIKKRFDPFEPIYLWIVVYAFLYLFKPLVQLLTNQPFSYGAEFLNTAIALAILGLIFFYAGYYSGGGRKIAQYIPTIKSEISSKRLSITAWIFIILGFLGFYFGYVWPAGGWRAFWLKPHGLAAQVTNNTAYIWQASELMVIGFILIYEIFVHRILIKKVSIKIRDVVVLLIASIGGIGILTIVWGSRTFYSWIGLAMILIYFLKKATRPKLKTVIIVILTLFLILTFIPVYRNHLYIGGRFSNFIKDINFKSFLSSAVNPGDEFNAYLAEVALTPNSIPYDNFALYYQVPLYAVPRIIWPDKPTLLNRQWNSFLSKSGMEAGAAESMLGDFYAQRGIFGIIIGTFLSGILWRTIYEYLKKAPQNRSSIIFYAILFPNIFSYIAQSALIGALKWVPYKIPALIIALLLSRVKKKDEKKDETEKQLTPN
jgi:oligosaccharide repeat unit polymerase